MTTNDEELVTEINQLNNKATLDVRGSLIKYVRQEIINSLIIISINYLGRDASQRY